MSTRDPALTNWRVGMLGPPSSLALTPADGRPVTARDLEWIRRVLHDVQAVTGRACNHGPCLNLLPPDAPAQRLYCSKACQVAAWRARNPKGPNA